MVDWANLSIFVGAVSGSLATIIYATQKSKCSHIECCCMKCDRPVDAIDTEDIEAQLEGVQQSGATPLSPPNSPRIKQPDSWIRKSG